MTKNIAASIKASLTKRAKDSNRPFQEVLQYYGLERFLYRLSQSRHKKRYILKGALMLRTLGAPESRPTRDIDFLAFDDNEISTIEAAMRDICVVKVQADGMIFDESTVKGTRIKEGAEYEGVRVKFQSFLEKSKIPMQIDIGFGDAVHPPPEEKNYPTLFDLPAPRLRIYPPEAVVAEKFEAMIKNGAVNSRMKDFFDVWLLASNFDFSGVDLAQSISATFKSRGTNFDTNPIALQ